MAPLSASRTLQHNRRALPDALFLGTNNPPCDALRGSDTFKASQSERRFGAPNFSPGVSPAMALRNLSTPELVSLCLRVTEEPTRAILLEHAQVPEDLLGRFHAMLARLMPHHTPPVVTTEAQALVATLSAKLTAADVHHDRKVRGIHGLLTALAELCDEESDRVALLALRDVLFPQGVVITRRTYAEQTGAAEQAALALTEAQRSALAAIAAQPAAPTLAAAFDAYVSAARSLRSIENDRSEAQKAATPPTLSASIRLNDRNAAVRLLNALIDYVTLDGEAHPEVARVFLDPLRALEATADARTAPQAAAAELPKPAPVPADAPPVAPEK